jgi:hypothetical protein
MACGSISRPLYRRTEFNAITFNVGPGNWARLLMTLSVIPSLRHSVSGLFPALTKGTTAIELTARARSLKKDR